VPTISLTQSTAQAVLRSFLQTILPGVDVIQGQDNRVPEPANVNFIVMTAMRRDRLETNIDTYADTLVTGSINGQTLTVAGVTFGALAVNNPIFGVGVSPNTLITALGTGIGGVGTYTISPSQSVVSEPLAAGMATLLQPTELTYQLDVHSNDVSTAADMAQTITTAFRDSYAVDFFTAQNPNVVPLYADEGRQIPFISGEEQYETRWIIEAHLQVNAALTNLPQQFAGALSVGLVDVNAAYPP
jgi:hypothetical protein